MSIKRKLALIPFLLPVAVIFVMVIIPGGTVKIGKTSKGINAADTAWILTSTALVFLMTPGLALFYGGMVSKTNVISTILQSFISIAIINILWVAIGFSLAFGDSINGIFENPSTFFMMNELPI